jgi:hypothetical protein
MLKFGALDKAEPSLRAPPEPKMADDPPKPLLRQGMWTNCHGVSVKACEQPDGAISVVLKSLDGSGGRRRDGFEDFEDEA